MFYFDIGAHVGAWALANTGAGDKTLSVEASPDTFKQLCANVQGAAIICENYAVCDVAGDVAFYMCKSANTLSTINRDWLTGPSSRFYGQPFVETTCKTISLDGLIAKHGAPDLIKIDVEGAEDRVVRSLTKRVPMVCFEWASETSEVAFQTIEHLQTLGFSEFAVQHGDLYTFRPSVFTDEGAVRQQLLTSTPKVDWGMIWCK